MDYIREMTLDGTQTLWTELYVCVEEVGSVVEVTVWPLTFWMMVILKWNTAKHYGLFFKKILHHFKIVSPKLYPIWKPDKKI